MSKRRPLSKLAHKSGGGVIDPSSVGDFRGWIMRENLKTCDERILHGRALAANSAIRAEKPRRAFALPSSRRFSNARHPLETRHIAPLSMKSLFHAFAKPPGKNAIDRTADP